MVGHGDRDGDIWMIMMILDVDTELDEIKTLCFKGLKMRHRLDIDDIAMLYRHLDVMKGQSKICDDPRHGMAHLTGVYGTTTNSTFNIQ